MRKFIHKHKAVIKDVITGTLAALFVFALAAVFFDSALIMSGSMEPTLNTGETVLFRRVWTYQPALGDIIEFDMGGEMLSKRVIGVPGDIITIINGKVYINGKENIDIYSNGATDNDGNQNDEFRVPDGKIFVLGDNRSNSCDSRYWKDPYVSIDDVKGIYVMTVSK